MSDRHIFNDHTTLVVRSLRGLVAHNPRLNLIPALKVVYRADADRSKVSLICGGGSGHEPGVPGFVGQGLLTAAVAGDVFASPSARQVLGGIKAVPSDKGTILIITNCESHSIEACMPSGVPDAPGRASVLQKRTLWLPDCDGGMRPELRVTAADSGRQLAATPAATP